MNKKLRKAFALIMALVLGAALTAPALAVDGTFVENNAAGRHDGSLFVAGQDVESAADVDGILLAAGYTVAIGGSSDYLMGAGYSVVAKSDSTVAKDGFAAGNVISFNGSVARDVFAAANAVIVGGKIGRSAYIAAENVTITGAVAEDLYVSAGSLEIADGAVIGGVVHVNSGAQITAPASVHVETYESPISSESAAADVERPAPGFGRRLLKWCISFAGVCAVAFVLLWLTPLWEKLDREYYGAQFGKYARAFGVGFGVLAGLPVAVILLMITRIGMRLAFVLLGVYAAAIIAAPVFIGFFLGALLWRGAFKKAPCYLAELPIGILVWRIAKCIPVLSFVVGFVSVPLGLGVIALLLGKGKSAPTDAAPIPEPVRNAPETLPAASSAPELPDFSSDAT